MARAAPLPSSDGAVMWKASADWPNPTTSAWMVAPRARACSRSSRIRAPAPSPMTKPLRRASNGREASAGRSLNLVARAVIWAKATSATWTKADSAPPATMAVASPWPMAWKARPMAWLEAAQAVVVVKLGPRRPSFIAIWPAAAFGISWGTVKGETRLGPLVRITASLASSELIPPMPVANTTPVSSLSTASSIPLSSQASRAEVRANWVERSSRLASLGPRLAAGSKSRHSAATLDGTGSGSTRVRGPRPDWPAQMASQYALAPTPTGVTAPSPVTTTRCKVLPHRRLLGDHQVGRLADGLDAGDLVVGDLDAELLLEGEHDLDQVERVGVQVLLEAGVGGHLVRLHAQLRGQDVLHRLDDFLARLRHLLVLLRAGGHDGGSGCRPCRLPVNCPFGCYVPIVMPPSTARTWPVM